MIVVYRTWHRVWLPKIRFCKRFLHTTVEGTEVGNAFYINFLTFGIHIFIRRKKYEQSFPE